MPVERVVRKPASCLQGAAGATTLVEALAGMAILGGVLVTMLMGQARLVAQQARADERLEACRLADRLLEDWWQDPDSFPRNDSGAVSGTRSWQWRTQPVANEEAEAVGAEVVALELRRDEAAEDADENASLRIEVLLPAPPDLPPAALPAAADTEEAR